MKKAVEMLEQAGYRPFDRSVSYAAGDKVYQVNRGKALIATTFGREPLEKGLRINGAHIDSPRLDLKPNPLYEKDGLALLKTHYYGGIRKYQWSAVPLAMHLSLIHIQTCIRDRPSSLSSLAMRAYMSVHS